MYIMIYLQKKIISILFYYIFLIKNYFIFYFFLVIYLKGYCKGGNFIWKILENSTSKFNQILTLKIIS